MHEFKGYRSGVRLRWLLQESSMARPRLAQSCRTGKEFAPLFPLLSFPPSVYCSSSGSAIPFSPQSFSSAQQTTDISLVSNTPKLPQFHLCRQNPDFVSGSCSGSPACAARDPGSKPVCAACLLQLDLTNCFQLATSNTREIGRSQSVPKAVTGKSEASALAVRLTRQPSQASVIV